MTPDKNAAESMLSPHDRSLERMRAGDVVVWSEKDMLQAIWRLADCEILRLFADDAPDANTKTYH